MQETITHKAIRDRAMDTARDAMPDMPKENTFEAWEDWQRDIEDVDAYNVAHQSCEWDWVIYYHHAMNVCMAVDSDTLHEAESEWGDTYAGAIDSDQFGLFEMAAQLATVIVTRAIAEAVEQVKEELIDLAQSQMDNLA